MSDTFFFQTNGKAFLVDGQVSNVLGEIKLTLSVGKVIGLLGESGCGKSTLLREVNVSHSREHPRPRASSSARKRVGFQKQFDTLVEYLTVYDNSVLFNDAELTWLDKSNESGTAAANALSIADMLKRRMSFPAELSGGMRQRIQTVQAVLGAPRLLLLDEPFSQLDLRTQEKMENWVLSEVRKHQILAVIVSHDLATLAAICSEVHVIGRLPAEITHSYSFSPRFDELMSRERRSSDSFVDCMNNLWEMRKLISEVNE
jgi:ABC-type nitrate/sulfonate/bicarbonate transport system ATPase subunit